MVGPRDSHVTILLSTFDGGSWLPELLASIAAQTHADWTLLVRDDGSTDETLSLLAAAAADDSRVELCSDDLGNLGPSASFMALLRQVDSGLFAFCDQDDIWEPHKLAASVAALGDSPFAAVFTDAEAVDARGRTTSPSTLRDRGLDPEANVPFGRLLINNVAIGATVLGTVDLANAAVTLADDRPVLMHDWWVALVSAHQGALTCLPESTIRWRRHPDTFTGDRPRGIRGRADRRREYLRWTLDAAARLRTGPPAATDSSSAMDAVIDIDPDRPTARDLVRAWRIGSVRAWSIKGQLSLVFSVGMGRTHQ